MAVLCGPLTAASIARTAPVADARQFRNEDGSLRVAVGDTLDLFYDVFVGRCPNDNAAHVANFIRKDTLYEKRLSGPSDEAAP